MFVKWKGMFHLKKSFLSPDPYSLWKQNVMHSVKYNDSYLSPTRQLSANNKMKNYKIKTSFVRPEGPTETLKSK